MTILGKFQKDRLRHIVTFAYENSAYYRKLYQDAGIDPYTIELPTGLPTVSAQDLIDHATLFKADTKIYKICASSGTIHHPKIMYRTLSDFENSVNNQIKIMKWANINSNDIVCIAQPFGLWGYGELTQEASKRLGATVIPVGMVADEFAHDIILFEKATVLDISPSRLLNLIKIITARNTQKDFRVDKILLAGEPIPNSLEDEVHSVFQAKIYNHFGSEELDALGASMQRHDTLHLLDDSFTFEYISDLPNLKNEKMGRLIVSSLYHKGTPLIRYQLNDIVDVLDQEKAIVRILGRSEDCVILYDSVKIFPYHIEAVLKSADIETDTWQCEVSDKEGVLVLKLILGKVPDFKNKQASLLQALKHTSIDLEALVRQGEVLVESVESPEKIQLSSRGKLLRFIDTR